MARSFVTVHARHVDVQKNKVRLLQASALDAFFSVVRFQCLVPEGSEQIDHQLQVRRIVFDYENASRGTSSKRRNRNGEAAAFTVFALEGNSSPNHAGQFLADVQPQAGAFISASGRAVYLHEGLEEFGLMFGPDADSGIRNRDFREEIAVIGAPAEFEPDRALIGKFDGVVRQVDQNLSQRAAVSLDYEIPSGADTSNCRLLAFGQRAQRRAHFLMMDWQFNGFQVEFDLAGFDLGQSPAGH